MSDQPKLSARMRKDIPGLTLGPCTTEEMLKFATEVESLESQLAEARAVLREIAFIVPKVYAKPSETDFKYGDYEQIISIKKLASKVLKENT